MKMTLEHIAKMQAGRSKAANNDKKALLKPLNDGRDENAAILARIGQIPPKYLPVYKRAISGKSRNAAIRAFCYECMGWEGLPLSVRTCTAPACPLFKYRPCQE